MSKNIAEQKRERKVINAINQGSLNESKQRTLQVAPASGTSIIGYPESGPVVIYDTIAANTTGYWYLALQPYDQTLTIWNFFLSVYVDPPGISPMSANVNYKLPYGSALSSAQKNMRISSWPDWGDSNDADGTRLHMIEIENRDSNSHFVLIAARFYGPYAEMTPPGP